MPTWLSFLLFTVLIGYMLWESRPALNEAAVERKRHNRKYRMLDNLLLLVAGLFLTGTMMMAGIFFSRNRPADTQFERSIGYVLLLVLGAGSVWITKRLLRKL